MLSVLSSEGRAKPIVGDRLRRWYLDRHRSRIIQLSTERLETTSCRKIEDTGREFKSELILGCTTLRRRFLFLALVMTPAPIGDSTFIADAFNQMQYRTN